MGHDVVSWCHGSLEMNDYILSLTVVIIITRIFLHLELLILNLPGEPAEIRGRSRTNSVESRLSRPLNLVAGCHILTVYSIKRKSNERIIVYHCENINFLENT